MDLSPKPLMRVLCAEPLEGRWLLSAAGHSNPTQADAAPIVTVTLGEVEEVGAEEEEEDEKISVSELPPHVLAAFNTKFGGATIEEVELEEDDERGTEYGITARHDGSTVDVTISPAGEIVETETFIELDELPQEVMDEVRKMFPGANIDEAADLGGGNFEVLLTNTDGVQYEVEATRVETPTPPQPAEEADPGPALPEPVQFASATDDDTSPAAEAAAAVVQEGETPVATAQAPEGSSDAQSREDVIEKNAKADAIGATTAPTGADRVAQALDELAAGTGASVWLPEVAGALVNVLPMDFRAIEQSVQDVLRQVGSIGAKKDASPLATGATRVAMAATLVAAVKVLLNQSRRTGEKRPALVFGPGGSSWGWVLGTSDAQRRRRCRVSSTPRRDAP